MNSIFFLVILTAVSSGYQGYGDVSMIQMPNQQVCEQQADIMEYEVSEFFDKHTSYVSGNEVKVYCKEVKY